MIVTYLRSSSYSQFDACEHAYMLAYTLGLPSPAGKKAALGNIAHKVLEVVAHKARCQQRGEASYEDENFGHLKVSEITTDWAIRAAFDHYRDAEPHHPWSERGDLATVRGWIEDVRTKWAGLCWPENLPIIEPERRFDLTIEEPWAAFRYDTPRGVIEGQLAIRGTIDLIAGDPHEPDAVHLLDWKTGRRLDWSTGEEKDFAKLSRDPQLLMYYWAVNKLYPTASAVYVTILYVADGGPFRLFFGPEHVEEAEGMLRRRFDEIRACQRPSLNVTWRCQKICPFGKAASPHDPSKTVCQFFAGEVARKGADAVLFEFGDLDRLQQYGDGGGRKAVA